MDTGKTYIMMCKKAEEVQGRHLEAGDFYARKGCGPDGSGVNVVKWSDQRHISGGKEITTEYVRHNKLDVTWLPRQDQLQEMVFGEGEELYGVLAGGQAQYLLEFVNSPYLFVAETLEQVWLAFVMKEKYSKQWLRDSQDWVKSEVLVNQGNSWFAGFSSITSY